MTKGELIAALAGMNDDEELFVVTSEYDADDDATWGPDSQAELVEVAGGEGEVLLVVDVSTFD